MSKSKKMTIEEMATVSALCSVRQLPSVPKTTVL